MTEGCNGFETMINYCHLLSSLKTFNFVLGISSCGVKLMINGGWKEGKEKSANKNKCQKEKRQKNNFARNFQNH